MEFPEPSHMPYFYGDVALCCLLNDAGRWKVHAMRDGAPMRCDTGLPSESVECSPACWFEDVWHFSFISRVDKSALWLYYGTTDDLRDMRSARPILKTPCGSIAPFRLSWMNGGVLRVNYCSQGWFCALRGYSPCRAVFSASDESAMYCSFTNGEDHHSFAVDLNKGTANEIIADGMPAYKFAVGDGLYYVETSGQDRRILKAKKVEHKKEAGLKVAGRECIYPRRDAFLPEWLCQL